jgi:iron-sulfur cluster insertion protein
MGQCTRYAVDENTLLNPIIFTEEAANKVAELIAEENNPNLKLRVYIEGGGCSGLQYGFKLDEHSQEEDQKTITKGVILLIDPRSFKYLSGATIDFLDDLEGERFTIQNPNAKNTCGCGSSFDVTEEN